MPKKKTLKNYRIKFKYKLGKLSYSGEHSSIAAYSPTDARKRIKKMLNRYTGLVITSVKLRKR